MIIDRDIYLVLLGGAIGFLSSLGTTVANHIMAVRLEIVKEERKKIYDEAMELRKRLLGEDDPEVRRSLLHGPK